MLNRQIHNMMDTEINAITHSKKTRQKSKVQETNRKPGGKIIRGCGRGGIFRTSTNSSSVTTMCILPSHVRESLQLTKLTVLNLDQAITESDVMQMFGEFGPLKFFKVYCDKEGGLMGYADVLFEKHSDAVEAMNKYNGIMINGHQISIQLTRIGSNSKKVRFTVSSVRKSNGGVQKKSKCKRKSHRRQKVIPINELLVAQLEDCMKSKLNIAGV